MKVQEPNKILLRAIQAFSKSKRQTTTVHYAQRYCAHVSQ